MCDQEVKCLSVHSFVKLLQGSISGPPYMLLLATPVYLWTSAQNPMAAPSVVRPSLWSTWTPTPPFWPGHSPTTNWLVGWSSTALASCMQEPSGSCWSRPASLLFLTLTAQRTGAQRPPPGGGVPNCRWSGPLFTSLSRGLEIIQELFRQDEPDLSLGALSLSCCKLKPREINSYFFCLSPGSDIH